MSNSVHPEDETASSGCGDETYWWQRFPTFAAVGRGRFGPDQLAARNVRVLVGNYAADPIWGPYGQYVNALPSAETFRKAKEAGLHWITWLEGFGDCVMYAAALQRNPDGSFSTLEGAPEVAELVRTAWGWEDEGAERGNTFRWVGLHNTANNEDFVMPLFSRERLGFPIPTYPDGRPALGWLPTGQYPVNARIYDACCSKDLNGNVDTSGEGYKVAEGASEIDPVTGEPKAEIEGLYSILVGPNELPNFPGRKVGETLYVSHMAAGKDPACPFWVEYARFTAREVVKRGLDGFWCDNCSPFNNFGLPPVRNGFGDWSEHRFREFLAGNLSEAELEEIGVGDPSVFEIRAYLKEKAAEFGAKDPSHIWDPVWRDPRWLDEPVWSAYKAFKQKMGQEALRDCYNAIKDEAAKAGRPDFCLAGNDMPAYGLGWAHDEWLDMVSCEQTATWNVATGTRGIMLPPLGKHAVIYRAGLEHQKGPYATAWYYLQGAHEKYRGKPELGKVLMAEAFANNTFLKHGEYPAYPGTPESVAWWNEFVTREERRFGRRSAVADVGMLFSPDNQLAIVVPGNHTIDHDWQPHPFAHWGMGTAMIDGHIPYRAVVDWKLEPESLHGLRTFVLPFVECLDERALSVLEDWVRAGGRLVITGPSGMRRAARGFFKRRGESILAPLVGMDMSEAIDEAYAHQSGVFHTVGADPTRPVLVEGGKTARQTNPDIKAYLKESVGSPRVHERRHGKGTVVWTSAPVGVAYYLLEEERAGRLGQIVEMIGPSTILDATALPSTVGVFCWQGVNGGALFADLVNYDLDADADSVEPAEGVQFRMRLPEGCGGLEATTLSPDGEAPAAAAVENGWALVELPRLVHFASVKLAAR